MLENTFVPRRSLVTIHSHNDFQHPSKRGEPHVVVVIAEG